MSGQWLNWLNIAHYVFSHQNWIAALLFSLWLYLEMQNRDSRIMDSCTQLTRSPGGFLYGRHRWKAGRSWGEDPSVESWSSRVPPLPKETRKIPPVPSECVLSLLCTRKIGWKVNYCWRCTLIDDELAARVDARDCELNYVIKVQILGGQLGASVRGEKMRKDAAPRGMVEKVLWVHRCHDVSQVLPYSCNRLSLHREV